jgi:hypothetical protein
MKTFEGIIYRTWPHTLDSGDIVTCFLVEGVNDQVFLGASDWTPLLTEAKQLGTLCRVSAVIPEPIGCNAPTCGDGNCEDPECDNLPEDRRVDPYLLRAESIEWL